MKKIIFALLTLIVISCGSENPSKKSIKDFMKNQSEYGELYGVSEKPDWEEGKRYEAITEKGIYLFYLTYNNEVVGVWRIDENGSRTQLFKKENQNIISETTESIEVPEYKILFKVQLMSGKGQFGEVLITSYSKSTPKEEREKTLRKIMEKEGFVSATLYSTEDAYKANSSESFSKSHPNALKNGLLGQVNEEGKFVE
ncbi:MAG: hypothetical protein AB7S48_05770 [Bacteroidales bacterium]